MQNAFKMIFYVELDSESSMQSQRPSAVGESSNPNLMAKSTTRIALLAVSSMVSKVTTFIITFLMGLQNARWQIIPGNINFLLELYVWSRLSHIHDMMGWIIII